MGKVFVAVKKGEQDAYRVGDFDGQKGFVIFTPQQVAEWLNSDI